MSTSDSGAGLHGVIAAAATPITSDGEPDIPRFLALCRWLLANGCDGLNICGTTGEATSFTSAQRMAIMRAAASELPAERLMAGTGAASVGDAVALTRHAAELGLAAALLLPPFYYKGVDDDGVVGYFDRIANATAARPVALYLYNFPALSGVEYTPSLVARLLAEFPGRIRGLKDSSGNLAYASEIAALSPELRVFPSNEAILLRARAGEFAGCISASANVNAPFCGRAYREGDETALERATRIRALLSRKALIPSVKAGLALRFDDPAFEAVLPPLSRLPGDAMDALVRGLRPLLD